jgi:eukaryotic-like serine/threonine-protein kinase
MRRGVDGAADLTLNAQKAVLGRVPHGRRPAAAVTMKGHRLAIESPTMPTPTPQQFWTLVAEAGLVDRDRLEALQSEFEMESLSPAATPDALTEAIAKWLVRRKVITLWQARRLVRGDRGPFFIGDYRLLERLEKDSYQGSGKGHLFRARHEPSGRTVLLMLLDAERCRDLEVWTGIVRRTTAANRATDPVLARTWALEQSGGQRFIVCEDVGGTPLTPELAARGPRPIAEVGPLMVAITRGVAELHRLGVVHGGISLEALRRQAPAAGAELATGRIRLLQFPLVADPHVASPRPAIDTPESITRLGTRAAFLAPELLLPNAVCDPRSDVYALGCVMQALLTGTLPCWQGSPEQTLSQAAFVGPEPLTPPQVPLEIATLVSYLVARDPAARYQSGAEAADAIAACFGLPSVSPSLPPQQPLIDQAVAAAPAAPVVARAAAVTVAERREPPSFIAPMEPPRAAARGVTPWLAYALGLAAVAAIGGGAVAVLTRPSSERPQPEVASSEKVAPVAAVPVATTVPGRPGPEASEPIQAQPEATAEKAPLADRATTTLVDAADVPWAAPTDGAPPTLAHLPPGSQLVLLARPADLLAGDEGRLFVRALGRRVERALAMVAAACGCAVDEVEFVQAGWQADPEAGPDAVVGGYAAWGRDPLPVAADDDARERAWGRTTARDIDGETVHAGAGVSYWLPDDGRGRVLVAAPENLLAEIVRSRRADADRRAAQNWRDRLEATLPPDLEDLVGMLDETRHLTLFGAPSYLLHDGRPVFAGPLVKLIEPLGAILGSETAAAALSLHCADTFYAEIDAIGATARSARKEAADLGERIAALADSIEEYCNTLDPHPYGRKLVMRLPRMLGILAANLRTGSSGREIVVNCHLPRHAGHNLALAAELAIEQTPAAGATIAAVATPAAGQSAADLLAKRISLTFARDTLEKSIQMLAEEIGVPIEILGKDLELEGITKNQSFGLDESDQPAEAILRTILAKSNPDGKLIYVFRKNDGGESIDVTTRAAAAKRGDEVPAVFADRARKPEETKSP